MTQERGTLFNGAMVRAILSDHKTQTRRVVKCGRDNCIDIRIPNPKTGKIETFRNHVLDEKSWQFSPLGRLGDKLWVRENTQKYQSPCGAVDLTRYSADGKPVLISGSEDLKFNGTIAHWDYHQPTRPSIHMPRWMSRIDLKITDVRVESLQDISEEDAMAEGALFHDGCGIGHSGYRHDIDDGCVYDTAKKSFKSLWESINDPDGPKGWKQNPWVWVTTFAPITRSLEE